MIERWSELQSLGADDETTTIDRLVVENENLRRKLQTLPVIEQAKGILMGRYGISAEAAFQMLRRRSQDTNTRLHLVAQTIVSNRYQDEDSGPGRSRGDQASTRATQLRGRET